jgi:hypothetical protein
VLQGDLMPHDHYDRTGGNDLRAARPPVHTVAIELLSAAHVPPTGLEAPRSGGGAKARSGDGKPREPYVHRARLSLVYLPSGRAGPDGAPPVCGRCLFCGP